MNIKVLVQGSESGDLIFHLKEYLTMLGIEVLSHKDDTPKTELNVYVEYIQNNAFMHTMYFEIHTGTKEPYADCLNYDMYSIIELKNRIVSELYGSIPDDD